MPHVRGYEKTAICPYNPSHLILIERLQTHLIKCAKNYPGVLLQKCPFNYCHLLKESELEAHVLTCEDRKDFDLYKYTIDPRAPGSTQNNTEALEPVSSGESADLIGGDENWDDDDHPTYDPQKYVETANVIRTLNVAAPSQKKAFREAERLRLTNFQG